jgi:hypothetical protein
MRHQAIIATHPNVTFINGDEAFDIDGNPVAYDEAAVQAYIAANQYKQQRAVEYPPLAEQLDLLYHDRINSTDTWMEAIQAVKNKYPKS